MRVPLILTICVLTLPQCKSTSPVAPSTQNIQGPSINYMTLKSALIPGKTTQTEVLDLLGSPTTITKNAKGQEAWTYRKRSSDLQSGTLSHQTHLLGFPGNTTAPSPSMSADGVENPASFTVTMTWGADDILLDYQIQDATQF